MTLTTSINGAVIEYEIKITDSNGQEVIGGAIAAGKYTMTVVLKNADGKGNYVFEGEDDRFTAHCDFEILEKVTIQITCNTPLDYARIRRTLP